MTQSIAPLPPATRFGAEWAHLDWRSDDSASAGLSWSGADTMQWIAGHAGGEVLSKIPRPHAAMLPHAAGAARQLAARLGVGPDVLAVDAVGAASIERRMDAASWRVGTLQRVRDLAVVTAIGRARQVFRDSNATLPDRDIGADAQHLVDVLGEAGIAVGAELQPAITALDALRDAVHDGAGARMCWMSGEISDVLLHDEGDVLLLGGTLAGRGDPLADVGALLAEVAPYALEPHDAFLALWGDDHPGAFARARLWGAISDLRAALLAVWANTQDSGSSLGYSDYAMRRMWRLRLFFTEDIDALMDTARKGWS